MNESAADTNKPPLTERQYRALMATDAAWLTPDQIARLTPDQIARLTPDQIARLTPAGIARLTPAGIAWLTPDQIARLTPDQIARLTPAGIAWLTLDQIARLTPDQIAWLTPAGIARLTPDQIARLTPDQIAWLTPDQIARLTLDQIARLTPAGIARLTLAGIARLTPDQIARLTPDQIKGHEHFWSVVPKVENLYSQILEGIQHERRHLDQKTFGPYEGETSVCDSPMCIAGHTVNLAGAAGYKLKGRFGFDGAARLIHAKSRPGVPYPRYDSYPNEWALAYIEERAAEENLSRSDGEAVRS